ncbi:hypothetical protein SPYSS1447_0524 [Streptococcus pyogenes SS1447]|nr:hypothetical protein SPYSS1447_0524 [Streptococcus pyogenes SS1447]
MVNSDITVTYTLKDNLVALHKEYKTFVKKILQINQSPVTTTRLRLFITIYSTNTLTPQNNLAPITKP